LTPERLAIFDSEPCKFAAVGIDHTIFLTEEGKVSILNKNKIKNKYYWKFITFVI